MTSTVLPASLRDYYLRVGAEAINFRKAIIKRHSGAYYEEEARITIRPDGAVHCSKKKYSPTEDEEAAIKIAIMASDFPKTISARNVEALRPKTKGDLFEFWDRKLDEIIFVQERRVTDGKKAYLPWVFLSNGEWESFEPDAGLPFWKPRYGHPGVPIMIHEGAKAARRVTEIVETKEPHPWLDELSRYEHWGMVGGALAPGRTNYAELHAASPREVVYVCDNDYPGRHALQLVSRFWGGPLKGIKFDATFPPAWDLGDPLPPNLFSGEGRFTAGPLEKFVCPATYATDREEPEGRGRPRYVLRSTFSEEWLHCVHPEIFVHRDQPHNILSLNEFNNRVRPFSDVDNTARLLMAEEASKNAKLSYDPSKPSGAFVHEDGLTRINTHRPSLIRPENGDAHLWEDFIAGLISDGSDRIELLRWCSTLVCRPANRILYGVLLTSEMQGIGKSTLGEGILTPLLGAENCSSPGEQDVVESNFNEWIAHKRLAVIHEIYAGHSFKAYNRLKSIITEPVVTINQKYIPAYKMENWVHIFACSNSTRALKPAIDDRRWLFPRVEEKKSHSPAFWNEFNRWLREGSGLPVIRGWMEDFLTRHEPIMTGQEAPNSSRKREALEDSYSRGQRLIDDTLSVIKARQNGSHFVTTDKALVDFIRQQLHGGRQSDHLEHTGTIRAVVRGMEGWYINETPAQVSGWDAIHWKGRIVTTDPELQHLKPGEIARRGIQPSASQAIIERAASTPAASRGRPSSAAPAEIL